MIDERLSAIRTMLAASSRTLFFEASRLYRRHDLTRYMVELIRTSLSWSEYKRKGIVRQGNIGRTYWNRGRKGFFMSAARWAWVSIFYEVLHQQNP